MLCHRRNTGNTKKNIDCRRRLKINFYFFLYVHSLDFTCKKLTNCKLEYFTGCKQDRCTKLLYGVFRNHLTYDIRKETDSNPSYRKNVYN